MIRRLLKGEGLGSVEDDGVDLPPLNQGKEAIMNLVRVKLADESSSRRHPSEAARVLFPNCKHNNTRYWVIRKRRFVSFFDPRAYATRALVDLDQVEAVDTKLIAFNDDLDDTICHSLVPPLGRLQPSTRHLVRCRSTNVGR
jgi:hypothetical protein